MSSTEEILKKLITQLPREAIEFFVMFSRFEYALKRNHKFLRDIRNHAEADWDTFADSLPKQFFEKIRSEGVAPELLATPPLKQIVKDGDLDWSEKPQPIKDVKQLFVSIRRVRNNLFHGGKFAAPNYVMAGTERERALLTQSKKVLELALEECAAIKGPFHELLLSDSA